ncbi:MAG: hypothetical protein A3G32_05185 [Deltaproteobacteria bacterium RIFCSPLOWO2_12_FULL_40_28]|nr:MAG: hypothetical protein A3C45_09295 [Deltaproteobacteria bacterium RIFCSPHIGHO2_02_FULL_40_28]OGQ19755.1 MAG: hypothetical protein A3E27_08490 [Deltaproteobacteria bacterium RIFCSPHIGHO2_12_FULL_40_32]OGQ41032.1 MAG: hypothetical protein A3I69_03905 [Deltaproteobacteria bacterium RIFCSPLOWO2_02_FULL_40_36]OGQ54148.1 MAG: hypothetical protein A3G32_05185 [Deltaproteobacteria bacterium RIFCSPLOWO2_12_FULL_40_28]
MKNILRNLNPLLFFSIKERSQIIEAIRFAEKKTSGEIRIHLEKKVKENVMQHATQVFEKLGMTKTRQRNGVLIFMALSNHEFAVLGDEGINRIVPKNYWDDIAQILSLAFSQNRFADGLTEAIARIGEKLQLHFPAQRENLNELPDEISFYL